MFGEKEIMPNFAAVKKTSQQQRFPSAVMTEEQWANTRVAKWGRL